MIQESLVEESFKLYLMSQIESENRFLSTWRFSRNRGQLPGVINIQSVVSRISCIKLIHFNWAYAYLMRGATENQFK